MSDLSRLLGDLYADESPARHEASPSEEALDDVFSSWVPGPPADAPAAERSMFAEAMEADAVAPPPAVDDWSLTTPTTSDWSLDDDAGAAAVTETAVNEWHIADDDADDAVSELADEWNLAAPAGAPAGTTPELANEWNLAAPADAAAADALADTTSELADEWNLAAPAGAVVDEWTAEETPTEPVAEAADEWHLAAPLAPAAEDWSAEAPAETVHDVADDGPATPAADAPAPSQATADVTAWLDAIEQAADEVTSLAAAADVHVDAPATSMHDSFSIDLGSASAETVVADPVDDDAALTGAIDLAASAPEQAPLASRWTPSDDDILPSRKARGRRRG